MDVRYRPPLAVAIVTHLVTQSVCRLGMLISQRTEVAGEAVAKPRAPGRSSPKTPRGRATAYRLERLLGRCRQDVFSTLFRLHL